MIIFDLLILILLLLVYLLIRTKNQFNVLVAAAAFFVAESVSSIVARPVFNYFQENGWGQDPYVTSLIYGMIIILIWGLLYAVISIANVNLPKKISKYSAIFSAILIAFATSIMGCFIAGNFTTQTDRVSICRLCVKTANFYKPEEQKSAFIPANLQEVYDLQKSTKIVGDDTAAENELLKLINKERINGQTQILVADQSLALLAKNYAESMVQSLRFSHIDAYNNTPDQRAKQQNVDYVFLGENLAIAPSVSSAHQALMASQSHRNNILSSKFQKVGLACYLLSDGSYIVVEEFSN